MDVERKTGGMARMPVGFDTDTKRGTREQASGIRFQQTAMKSLQQENPAASGSCPTERSESRPAEAEHERG
jgi:hypothetical protein